MTQQDQDSIYTYRYMVIYYTIEGSPKYWKLARTQSDAVELAHKPPRDIEYILVSATIYVGHWKLSSAFRSRFGDVGIPLNRDIPREIENVKY